jgi:Protein of unknown function (DUF2795)
MVGGTQQPQRVDIPEVQAAISRLDFPVMPRDLAARVAERGGDERVAAVLSRLPDRRYETPADVVDAVRELDPEDRDGRPNRDRPNDDGGDDAA